MTPKIAQKNCLGAPGPPSGLQGAILEQFWAHFYFGLVKHKEIATGGLKSLGLAEKSGA